MSEIASTIARIEALVQSKELAEPTAWDKAWDMRWKEVWGKHGPVPRQQKGGLVQSLARAIRGTTTISVVADGCTAGRTAGRTPVELSLSKTTSTIMRTIFTEDRSRPSVADTSSMPRGENDSIIPLANNPHSPTETIRSDLHNDNDIGTERYSYVMNWLGYSCLLSGSETCRVWATPRESAIEFAWNTVWPVAQSAGEDAAEAVLGFGMRLPENDSQTQIKRTSARSSLLAGVLSRGATVRLKIPVNRRHSTSQNLAHHQTGEQFLVDATPGTMDRTRMSLPNPTSLRNTYFPPRDSSYTADHVLVEDPQTIMPSAGTDSPAQASFPQIERSTLPPTPRSRLPDFSLRSIPEGPSHTYDLPGIPSRRISRAMSEPVPASTSAQVPVGQNSNPSENPSNANVPRRRRESAIKRLREHVVTRWSDPLRYINTEFEDAFTKKIQERDYHRKKSIARKDAVRMIINDSDLLDKLPEEGIRLAREAWESAETTVGKHHFEQKLKALARQEWEKLVERHKVTYLSTPLQDDPNWEENFMSTWKQAWQESWAAAWTGVCSQAYNEATTRSVEFGVEKILDSQSTLNRQTYEQLLKGSSYFKLCQLLSKDLKSPSTSLEQIHQWMKELNHLSESLQHSIPTLRDDCMEITVFESIKPETMAKATRALLGSLGTDGATGGKLTSRKITHYEFQKWVTNDYIVRKVHKDDPVYGLFLRGIEEVWDFISRPGAT
ncbi:similar to terribly reduced optic lobes CG33950-PA [Rhizoctonia solani]|uniref:Similar to terribly reduced optic lobes CG33950-PA n=1 Tax=Rhizoctonia solani TaxID=456999 RepID=A0A0K6FNT0_9AGAM|nr:similar to terribly reduced optic lobes CG33950-PA [Rhizoctonia solani]